MMDVLATQRSTHSPMTSDVTVWTGKTVKLSNFPSYLIWQGDVEKFLDRLQQADVSFDLMVTSPPYNMGKKYERRTNLEEYLTWQERVISKTVRLLSPTGSLCWQVGNFVDEGSVLPLDLLFHPIMGRLGLTLRNRIVWRFGHGLHCKRRFSGCYEV